MSLGMFLIMYFNTSTPAQPLSKGCRWQPVRTQVKSRLSCENEHKTEPKRSHTLFSHSPAVSGLQLLEGYETSPVMEISTQEHQLDFKRKEQHENLSTTPRLRAHSAKAASVEKGSILGFADSVPINPVYANLSLSRLESAQGKDLEAAKPPQSDSSPPLTSGHSSTS